MALINKRWLANLFAEHPDAFVEIVHITGGEDLRFFYPDYVPAFGVLNNEKGNNLFAERPEVVVNAFAEIARFAGEDAKYVFLAISKENTYPWILENLEKLEMLLNIVNVDKKFVPLHERPSFSSEGRSPIEMAVSILENKHLSAYESYEIVVEICQKARDNSKEYLIPSILSAYDNLFKREDVIQEDIENLQEFTEKVISEHEGETAMKTLEFFSLFYKNESKDVSSFENFADSVFISQSMFEVYISKYGVRPMSIAGFLDGERGEFDPETYNVGVEVKVNAAIKRFAEEKKLEPSLLAAVLFQEAFVLTMMNSPEVIEKEWALGTRGAGANMDYFYQDMPALKEGGYLRKDFEQGVDFNGSDPHISFRDLNVFVEAFSAEVAWRRDLFFNSLGKKEIGIDPGTLSKEQEWAGTYMFFNANDAPSKLKDIINSKGIDGLLEPVSITRPDVQNYRYNYMRVVSTTAYLRDSGVFGE